MSYVVDFLVLAIAFAIEKLGLDRAFGQLPGKRRAVIGAIIGALICGIGLALLLPLIAGPPNLGEMARTGALIGAAGGAIIGFMIAVSPLGLILAIVGALIAVQIGSGSPAIITAAALIGLIVGVLVQFRSRDVWTLVEGIPVPSSWPDVQNKVKIVLAVVVVAIVFYALLFRESNAPNNQGELSPPSKQQLDETRSEILERGQGQWEINRLSWDSRQQIIVISITVPSSDSGLASRYCNILMSIGREYLRDYRVVAVIDTQGANRFQTCS